MTLISGNKAEGEGLCSLFTETMSSISEDCAVLRQLASLQIATGTQTDDNGNGNGKSNASQPQAQARAEVNENIDPNTMQNVNTRTQNQIQQNMIQQLNGIDSMLNQLETKVSTIQHVLNEEQQSMEILEQSKVSAMGQAKVIQEIRQGMEDQELNELLPGNGLLKMGFQLDTLELGVNKNTHNGERDNEASVRIGTGSGMSTATAGNYRPVMTPQLKSRTDESARMQTPATTASNTTAKPKLSSTSTRTLTSISLATPKATIRSTPMMASSSTPHTGSNTHSQSPSITLRPITQTEFHHISKNIRGRITLSAVNEALLDIQNVAQHKYSILASRKTPRALRSSKQSPSPGLISHHHPMQYQQTLSLHKELRSEDHDGLPFVSEQEMRDSCAFFRSGESTARAILLILRSAKRIKQVCGRNSQVTVTYVWLNNGE